MLITDAYAYTKASLALFKRIPAILTDEEVNSVSMHSLKTEIDILTKYGFAYTLKAKMYNNIAMDPDIIEFIDSCYGKQVEKMNQGFYHSFKAVAEADYHTLVMDQLTHYFSTYGLESLGIDSKGFVYIPSTELDIPKVSEPFVVLMIDVISEEDLIQRLSDLVHTKAALDFNTIQYIIQILNSTSIDFSKEIDSLSNKELKIALYDFYHKVPTNPVEFLRFVIFKKTGNTLLIKNKSSVMYIMHGRGIVENYFKLADLTKLAEIFYRFKPLWLAFKHESSYMASVINKIRKLADKYHVPSKSKILDTLTSSNNIDMQEFRKELSKVSVFKRISLLNALLYRAGKPNNITYFIRNGLSFTEEYNKDFQFNPIIMNIVFNSIVSVLRENVKGKVVYIPDTIDYATPTSAKLFWNNIPYGSSIKLNKDVVVAVHWTNVVVGKDEVSAVHWTNLVGKDEVRIDLDLHLNSNKYNIGWNSRFDDANELLRTRKTILFSGDMTSAPVVSGGATEAYFVGNAVTDTNILVTLNYYNFNNNYPVNFELIIDNADPARLTKNYLINSHTTMFNLKGIIDKRSEFIGILECDAEGNKVFHFNSASVCKGNVSRYSSEVAGVIDSLCHSSKTSMRLKTLLIEAGAILVDKVDEDTVVDIDLSPVNVTKDVFLSLFAE